MKPRFLRFLPLASVLSVSLSSFGFGGNLYWSGADSSWNVAGNWSSDPNSHVAAGAFPATGDDVFFNVSILTADQLILMNANRTVNSLTFSSTGATSIQGGGGSARNLNVGAGGILINSGAGAVTLGSTTTGFGVAMRIAESQTWTNNSSNLFTVTNSIQSTATSGTQTLTIGGSGNTTLLGAVSNGSTGGTIGLTKTGSGTLSVISNSYTGVTTLAGGIFQIRSLALGGASSSIGASTADSANLVFDGGTFGMVGGIFHDD